MTEPFEVKVEQLNQQIARVEKYFTHTYPGVVAEIRCNDTEPAVCLSFDKSGDRRCLRIKRGEGGYTSLTNASLDLRILAVAHLYVVERALRAAAQKKYGALNEALGISKKFAPEFHG